MTDPITYKLSREDAQNICAALAHVIVRADADLADKLTKIHDKVFEGLVDYSVTEIPHDLRKLLE